MKSGYYFLSFFLIIFFFGVFIPGCGKRSDLFRELDAELALKDYYDRKKLTRICNLTDSILTHRTQMTPRQEYEAYRQLSDEYLTFNFDSSYKYNTLLCDLARKIDEPAYLVDSRARHSFIMANGGFFKESIDSLIRADLSSPSIPDSILTSYHIAFGRVYHNYGDYTKLPDISRQYYNLGNEQLEKAISFTGDSVTIYWLEGKIAVKEGDLGRAREKYLYAVNNFDVDSNMLSVLLSTVANIEVNLGNYDNAIEYYTRAAIGNIRNGKTESVSLRGLASLIIHNKKEIDRAAEYMNVAIEDAQFYGAKHRMVAVESLLPLIIREQLRLSETKKREMSIYLIIITVLACAVVIAFVIVSRQKKELEESKTLLQDLNGKLADANRIKEGYIGYYVNMSLQAIDQVDRFVSIANRKLDQKQYQSLRSLIQNLSTKYNKDRSYRDFDKTFLDLFPTFVDDFNLLLKPGDRITVPPEKLNATLRIFALVKLGVTSSEEISKILGYSLNTIYNYRTRIKNKSLTGSEEFEDSIRQIGI